VSRWLLRAIATAFLGAALTGCGGETSHHPATRPSVLVAPVSSRSPRPWHLVKRPIVVVSRPAGADEPRYLVYFRLDHALATRHDAVLVRLNGVSNYNTSGTGYDGSAGSHCYTKAIDNFKDFPRSLLRPRAADLLTVSLRFRRPPGNTTTARVPLQVAGPADPGWSAPSPARLRTLGCSS
jgi:hypothetical protein